MAPLRVALLLLLVVGCADGIFFRLFHRRNRPHVPNYQPQINSMKNQINSLRSTVNSLRNTQAADIRKLRKFTQVIENRLQVQINQVKTSQKKDTKKLQRQIKKLKACCKGKCQGKGQEQQGQQLPWAG